jgi:hypothetical protein
MSCSHNRRRTHCQGVVGAHKHTTRSGARENGPEQGHSSLLVHAPFRSQPVRPRNPLRPKKETLRSYDFTTVLTRQLQDGSTLLHTRMFSFWRVAFITISWALLVTPVDRRLAAALLPASSAPRLCLCLRRTGILGLQDRIEVLHGKMTLSSPVGSGAVIDVAIPLVLPPREFHERLQRPERSSKGRRRAVALAELLDASRGSSGRLAACSLPCGRVNCEPIA